MNSSVPVSYKDMPLAALAEIRSDAKVQEDMAVAYRRDIDKEIALRLKDCDEGTVSSTKSPRNPGIHAGEVEGDRTAVGF